MNWNNKYLTGAVLGLVLLLCITIPLANFKGCNKPDYPKEPPYIDTLTDKVKTNEQIKEDVLNNPFLSTDERDSLFSKWERENGLSRFRDSIK